MRKFNKKFGIGLAFSLLFCILQWAHAQPTPDSLVVAVGDRFFAVQNYPAAITEYQRALYLNPRTSYQPYLWLQMARCYKQLGNYTTSADYLKKILHFPLSPSVRETIRFHLALTYLLAQKPALANLEFFKLEKQTADSLREVTFRAFRLLTLILQHQWALALQEARQLRPLFSAEAQPILQRIIAQLSELAEHPHLKSPTIAHRLSTILPGSGQIYAGDWRNGINAFLLNAGTVYLLWQSITIGSWLDLALIGSFVWWRYYEGNRVRTTLIVQKRNAKYIHSMTNNLLTDLQQLGQFLPPIALEIPKQKLILP